MFMHTRFIKKMLRTGLCVFMLCFTTGVFAKVINLEPGQSEYIELSQKVDTIFVSSGDIADYEIIDDNNFVIYAKQEGKTEITAFDQNGNTIYSSTVNVNLLINNIADTNQQIKARFPNTKLQVKKVGKAYVIEGKAASSAESEEVNRIVGEALGATPKVTEYTLKRGTGTDEKIPFLDKYQYQGVINNSKVEDNAQINVKLTVVEVNKNFTDALGINWTHLGGNILKNLTSHPKILGTFDGSSGGNGGVLNINADNLRVFINALDNRENGKILAEPNISMLSGETADILVGGEVPFVQRDRDGNPTIIYKDYGIKLVVGGQVQKNDRIRLALAQEVSTLVGGTSFRGVDGEVPYFNTRRAKSTFEIANGESFIIGGLLSSNDAEGLKKVPLLGDIPIIGAFFRSATTTRQNKELVVVATVNLVKPVNGDDIVYPSFEQTGTMERFFNFTPIKNVYHKTLTTNFLKNGGFIQ